MSDTSATPPPSPSQPPAPPKPVRPSAGRRLAGCLGRIFAALLVILITTGLTLAAVAYAALNFGYGPQVPAALTDAQARVATLEAENSTLKAESVAVQTQLSQMTRQSGTDREEVDSLSEQVESFAQISDEVATRLAADSRERSTQVAEIRDSRDAVVIFSTAEAGRAELLEELRRRSERVERFLQRLSDISGDTVLDLSNGTPTATPSALPSPTAAETQPTPTPAAVESTPTPTEEEQPTPTAEATPSPTPRQTATPAPTARP